MIRLLRKHIMGTVMLSVFLVLIVVLLPGNEAVSQNIALVRIYNGTDYQVAVYSQTWSYSGLPRWNQILLIPPRQVAHISNVPHGAMLGARVAISGGYRWQPFPAQFNPYMPVMEVLLQINRHPQLRRAPR